MASEPAADEVPFLSPNERRQRNRDEMQKAILDAARLVMREQGVAALSLREVARRVKMQAPSLYTYYPSKMALYDALFLEGIRRYAAYREVNMGEHSSFWDTLHDWVETYMGFAQEHPELYQLCFERPVPGFVPSEASMEESRRLLAGSEGILAKAVDNGEILLDIPYHQARDLIIAMIQGLTSQHLANEPDLPIGSGRYGALIPAAVSLFRGAWEPKQIAASGDGGPDHPDGGGSARKEVGG